MNVNQVIHEARGFKWHEIDNRGHCLTCNTYPMDGGGDFHRSHPRVDYAGPVHYCDLMDWMREGDRAQSLDRFIFNEEDYADIQEWLVLTRQEQVNLIAEAIEAEILK